MKRDGECEALGALLRRCGDTVCQLSIQHLNCTRQDTYFGRETPFSGAFATLAHDIAGMTALRDLDIFACRLQDDADGADAAQAALATMLQLTSLKVSHYEDDRFRGESGYLCALLRGMPAAHAQHLHLDCVEMDQMEAERPEQYQAVLQCLSRMTALTHLEMSEFPCTDQEGRAGALAPMHQLTHLALPTMNLLPDFAAGLSPHLAHFAALRHLDVHNNMLMANGVRALLRPLATAAQVTYLDLRQTGIGARGLLGIEMMPGMAGEQGVHGVATLSHVAPYLGQMTSLQVFRFDDNIRTPLIDVASGCAAALADALGRLISLQELTMSSNELGRAGVQAIAPSLALLTQLTCLHLERVASRLHHVEQGKHMAQALAPAVSVLSQLKDLVLSDNGFQTAGVTALAAALGCLSGLQQLSLDLNSIGSAGVHVLAHHASSWGAMSALRVGDKSRVLAEVPVSDESKTALEAALPRGCKVDWSSMECALDTRA